MSKESIKFALIIAAIVSAWGVGWHARGVSEKADKLDKVVADQKLDKTTGDKIHVIRIKNNSLPPGDPFKRLLDKYARD